MIGKQNEFPNVLDEEGSNIENDRNEFAFKKFEDPKTYISIILFFRLQFDFECYRLIFAVADLTLFLTIKP